MHYSRDALGNITETTDDTGAVVASYSYDAWGNDTETLTDPDGPENPFRFTGEYLDADTGLYNLRARQYDPQMGRFTQTDPLPQPADQPCETSYAYAKNRPTALIDSSGKRCERQQDAGDGALEDVGEAAMAIAAVASIALVACVLIPSCAAIGAWPTAAYIAEGIVLLELLANSGVPADAATGGGECGCSSDPVDLDLKYMDEWDDAQRAAADEKVRRLQENQDTLQKSKPDRRGAQSRYRKDKDLDGTVDADHIIDLQLGGRDTLENFWELDKSVNRSLGSQIAAQLRDACLGTKINSITIS